MVKTSTFKYKLASFPSRLSALVVAVAMMIVVSAPASHAAPLVPPAVPTNGAYVGAWVNPGGLKDAPGTEAGTVEIQQLPAFNQNLGGPTSRSSLSMWDLPRPFRRTLSMP